MKKNMASVGTFLSSYTWYNSQDPELQVTIRDPFNTWYSSQDPELQVTLRDPFIK